MAKVVPQAERPRPSQVASMTLLLGLAWLPLISDIAPRVSVFTGFLLALRLASLRWLVLLPGRWLMLPLTVAGMVAVLSDYKTFVGRDAGAALLATMLVLKLLEMHRVRDLRVGTLLFGFLLVSQFLFDQSPLRALYLALLLVLDFALMADLTARVGEGRRALISALRIAGRLCLQALPLVLVLFVLFPRLSSPLWSLSQQRDRGQTGMSDWMEPGSLDRLVLSPEPAFRARFDGPVPPQDKLYWRGPVIWHTDGRRWTGWPAGLPLGVAERLVDTSEQVAYQVELEPTGKPWLFVLDMPVRVPDGARILGDFQVKDSTAVSDNRAYRAVSALSYETGGLDLDQESVGTQLPENITERMRSLVAGWQREVGSREELVHRALAFFREEPFHYTLFPPKLGANPADEFLFVTRRGFCEHYAGSFALLMRIAGIPTRIVLGYMGGEHNPLGDYLIVRQSDAHAWVEVWLRGRGWIRVDPTAAVAPERIERSDLFEVLAAGAPLRFRLEDVGTLRRWVHDLDLLGDAITTGWRDWVVGLSRTRQQQMLETLGLGHLRAYGLALALIVAAGAVLGIFLAVLTRRTGSRDPLERIYTGFCKRLARIGLPRRPGEGPLDFAQRVTAARPDLRVPVESFMAVYLPQRYGAYPRPAGRRELERKLRRFRPRRR